MAIAPGATIVDYIIPARTARRSSLLRDAILVSGASLVLALCAQLSFHLPFTPVPVTLQTLGVLLCGAALGGRRGVLAMLLYLAEGAMGLPVFAGGLGGIVHLAGYTGGYLWSYPLAAGVVGWLCQRQLDRRFLTSAIAMLPSTLIIYAIGVPWLGVVLHLSLYNAFLVGMVPFVPGDLVKLAIAAALLPSAWAVVRRFHNGAL